MLSARLVGIVNLTEDSFSDGGAYLDPEAAVEHVLRLRRVGANLVELGPASCHPDARARDLVVAQRDGPAISMPARRGAERSDPAAPAIPLMCRLASTGSRPSRR